MYLKVSLEEQSMSIIDKACVVQTYPISAGKNGGGQLQGSECTPYGWHMIRAKIGNNLPRGTVFSGRRSNGEICTQQSYDANPSRDWIITRILWLSGLETGKNRLGNVDTMRRYVYIHGTPDCVPVGKAGSRGCIRMRNDDILALFDRTPLGCKLLIC